MNDEQFGSWLRRQRERKHMTQEDLALKLGVHYVTVLRWEKDQCRPSPLAVKQIEEIFGIRYKMRYAKESIKRKGNL